MSPAELLGREPVLGILSSAVTTVAARGGAVLLAGEPGTGRTACLQAADALARAAGCDVLETAGSEAESAIAYAGLHRLLQPLLALADVLPAVQRQALLTALGSQEGPRPELLVVALAALGLIVRASAHRPLVIIADDLHRLDEPSRRVLTFLARRLDRARTVILAAASPVRTVTETAGAFHEVRLGPLDDTTADRLVRRRAPGLEDARRQWVVRHAAGNPLALVELAALAGSTTLPRTDPPGLIVPFTRSLRQTFGGRLHELPGSSRDVVLVAAMAFDDSLPEILAATALLSRKPVTTAVLEAPQALGILRFDDTAVRFTHPLVKSAVAHDEPVSRRRAAHAALGQAITVSTRRRTWHRAHGADGEDEQIAMDLERISAEDTRRGDSEAALLALRRAAQLSATPAGRGHRLLLAARQADRMGRRETARRLLSGALDTTMDEADRIRAELLGFQLDGARAGGSERVLRLCALATRAAAAGERQLSWELAYEAGLRSYWAPVDHRPTAAVVTVAEGLPPTTDQPLRLAVRALADPVRHGREVVSELAAVDDRGGRDPDAWMALTVAAYAVGDYARCALFGKRAEEALREAGLGASDRLSHVAADIRLDLGDWGPAPNGSTPNGSTPNGSTPNGSTPNGSAGDGSGGAVSVPGGATKATAAKAAALRGDTAAAFALAVEAEHAPGVRAGCVDLARAQIARGIAYMSSSRYADAYLALSRVFEPGDPAHHVREQCTALGLVAEAAVRGGHHDDVRSIMERMETLAATAGWPLLRVQMLYARAVLAGDDTAERLFVEGLASDLGDWPWPRARIRLAFGRWLRRRRQVSRSREPLRQAHTDLRQIGAARWEREAMDELEATGHRGDESPGALSAQEWKTARLAAQGLSNTEIGQQLGLSPRTVGSHLYRIFPKLGITARGQLAARLAALP